MFIHIFKNINEPSETFLGLSLFLLSVSRELLEHPAAGTEQYGEGITPCSIPLSFQQPVGHTEEQVSGNHMLLIKTSWEVKASICYS